MLQSIRHTLSPSFSVYNTRTQPCDIKPLSTAYSTELSSYLHISQGLSPVKKGDFFRLFWSAWKTSFTSSNIISSFKATGISPPNPDVILRRYNKEASSSDESSSSVLSGDRWLKIETLVCRSVQNQNTKEVKKIRRSLHHISAQNSILRAENRGLGEALFIEKKHEKKSYTLQLNNSNEYHGAALFYSPKKIRQLHLDEIEKRRQKDEMKLQRAERRQLQKQARLCKLQQAEDRRVERERLKEVREKEKAAKAAQKEAQKIARDTEKAIQWSQKSKRKASQPPKSTSKRQKRAVVVPSHVEAAGAAIAVPAQKTKTRLI